MDVLPSRWARCAAALVAVALVSCGNGGEPVRSYGAERAPLGESRAVLGWNISVSDLRFESDHVLVDVDATPADPSAVRANPGDLRFGLYGALAHPIEVTGVGSCDQMPATAVAPLQADEAQHLSGAVCLGPISEQAQVRGVYVYSPRDRIAGTTVAYPAAFPLGLPPTNSLDSGLMLSTTSVEAWRADGTQLTAESLGDPRAFTGNGYMLLGLRAEAAAAAYLDESVRRGGPMMLVVAPTLPPPGLSRACSAYGASVLVLPEASLDAVRVEASLCTQGEINAALLYATVAVVGTHAAVWIKDGDR